MKVIVLLAVILSVAIAAPPADFHLSALVDDFNRFLKLIPVDKIKAIAEEHLQNDAEFGDVIRYLQGDEWAKIVGEVKSKPEVQDFENYMRDAGLDVGAIVARIHNFLAGLKPGTQAGKDENLRSFLDAVEKEIPIVNLTALLDDRMQNSEDFKAFYQRISSQKSKELVEEVRALPEVQRLEKKLTDMGVRVKEVLDIIYEFLRWDE